MKIQFFVTGIPAPQGSKRGIPLKSKQGNFTGAVSMVENSKKLAPWRDDVRCAAERAMIDNGIEGPLKGPLRVNVCFFFFRPKYHFGTGKNADKIKERYLAPWYDKTPDVDKLERSTYDALESSRMFINDCQICDGHRSKRYTQKRTGALIIIETLSS